QVQQEGDENGEHVNGGRVVALSPSQASEFPPLKVLFGLEQLADVINGVLSPEERLGKLALHTQSRSEAARGQFLDIMRKFATEMGCFIEVEDLPDEYTVCLYGSRRQIGAIMRALAPRGECMITIGVLTISDSVSKGEQQDLSGPAIRSLVA